MSKQRKPGTAPENRIGIYDENGCRGHCGPRATEVTVSRFGVHNAELKKISGRLEWHGQSFKQHKRAETANHKAARGSVPAK